MNARLPSRPWICDGYPPANYRNREIAVIDTETTGLRLRHDRIIELAVAVGRIGGPFEIVLHERINPEMPIPASSTAIHGFTDDDVSDAPVFADLLPHLADALGGRPLAAFNLPFDHGFLRAEMSRAGMPDGLLPTCGLDPHAWASIMAGERRSLASVTDELGIRQDVTHRADADALAAAATLGPLLTQMAAHPRCGPMPLRTLGTLWAWTRREVRQVPSLRHWTHQLEQRL